MHILTSFLLGCQTIIYITFAYQLHVDLSSYILYHHVNMHEYFHPNIGMLSTYLLDALFTFIKLKPIFHFLP